MDFTLPTGSKLVVSEAAYADADALLKALVRCAKGIALPKNFLEADVTVLKEVLVEAITSDEVDQALFKCAERAVYENAKVTRALFDDPKLKDAARQDRFLIAWHIIEVNCGPFFGKTFSILRERLRTSPSFQPSPSESTKPS
jgi:hypothetical protein